MVREQMEDENDKDAVEQNGVNDAGERDKLLEDILFAMTTMESTTLATTTNPISGATNPGIEDESEGDLSDVSDTDEVDDEDEDDETEKPKPSQDNDDEEEEDTDSSGSNSGTDSEGEDEHTGATKNDRKRKKGSFVPAYMWGWAFDTKKENNKTDGEGNQNASSNDMKMDMVFESNEEEPLTPIAPNSKHSPKKKVENPISGDENDPDRMDEEDGAASPSPSPSIIVPVPKTRVRGRGRGRGRARAQVEVVEIEEIEEEEQTSKRSSPALLEEEGDDATLTIDSKAQLPVIKVKDEEGLPTGSRSPYVSIRSSLLPSQFTYPQEQQQAFGLHKFRRGPPVKFWDPTTHSFLVNDIPSDVIADRSGDIVRGHYDFKGLYVRLQA